MAQHSSEPTARYHCSWSACSRLYVKTGPGHTYCGWEDCPATTAVPAHAALVVAPAPELLAGGVAHVRPGDVLTATLAGDPAGIVTTVDVPAPGYPEARQYVAWRESDGIEYCTGLAGLDRLLSRGWVSLARPGVPTEELCASCGRTGQELTDATGPAGPVMICWARCWDTWAGRAPAAPDSPAPVPAPTEDSSPELPTDQCTVDCDYYGAAYIWGGPDGDVARCLTHGQRPTTEELARHRAAFDRAMGPGPTEELPAAPVSGCDAIGRQLGCIPTDAYNACRAHIRANFPQLAPCESSECEAFAVGLFPFGDAGSSDPTDVALCAAHAAHQDVTEDSSPAAPVASLVDVLARLVDITTAYAQPAPVRVLGTRCGRATGGATVTGPDGTVRTVLNLGWLLRNARDVVSVEFWARGRADAPGADLGGRMVAQLAGGRTYATDWASRSVFADWICRPRFAGVPVSYVEPAAN